MAKEIKHTDALNKGYLLAKPDGAAKKTLSDKGLSIGFDAEAGQYTISGKGIESGGVYTVMVSDCGTVILLQNITLTAKRFKYD